MKEKVLVAGLESGLAGDIKKLLDELNIFSVELTDWNSASGRGSYSAVGAHRLVFCTGSRSTNICRAFDLNARSFIDMICEETCLDHVTYVSSRVVSACDEDLSAARRIYKATKTLGELTLSQWADAYPERTGVIVRPPVMDTEHVREALQNGDPFYTARVNAQGGVVPVEEAVRVIVANLMFPQGKKSLVQITGPGRSVVRAM